MSSLSPSKDSDVNRPSLPESVPGTYIAKFTPLDRGKTYNPSAGSSFWDMQTQVVLRDRSTEASDGDTSYPVLSEVVLLGPKTRTLISMDLKDRQVRTVVSVEGGLSQESMKELAGKGVYSDLKGSSVNNWSFAFELDPVDLPLQGSDDELRLPGDTDEQSAKLLMDNQIRKLAATNPDELCSSLKSERMPAPHEKDFEMAVKKVPGRLRDLQLLDHYICMADKARYGIRKWNKQQRKGEANRTSEGDGDE